MDYEEFGRFEIEENGVLNIDIVDINLTKDHLIVSLSFKGKGESRTARLKILPTEKLRELLANLDAIEM